MAGCRADDARRLGGRGGGRHRCPVGVLDIADVGGVVLTPGVGAQGGSPADVARLFGRYRPGTVLANASRSILSKGPGVTALRAAAEEVRDAVAAAIT